MKTKPTYEQVQKQNYLLKKELKEIKNNKLDSFFENNKAIMLAINTTTKQIINANKSALDFYGYSKEELLQKTINDLNTLPPDEIEIRMLEASKNKANFFQFKHKLSDGSIKDVEVYSSHFKTNNLIEIYITIIDITKHEETEKALQQRDRYLSSLNKAATLLLQKDSIPYQEFTEIVGKSANASRTYIFKNHRSNNGELLTNQIAEYCNNGIIPEIDNPELQNLSFKNWIPRWETLLSENKIVTGKILLVLTTLIWHAKGPCSFSQFIISIIKSICYLFKVIHIQEFTRIK